MSPAGSILDSSSALPAVITAVSPEAGTLAGDHSPAALQLPTAPDVQVSVVMLLPSATVREVIGAPDYRFVN